MKSLLDNDALFLKRIRYLERRRPWQDSNQLTPS